jgi:hypothetical protein
VSHARIQFLVDSEGRKTAVVLDLEEHGELWEDIMMRGGAIA